MKKATVIKNSRNPRVYLLVDEKNDVIDFSSSITVIKRKYARTIDINIDLDREIWH